MGHNLTIGPVWDVTSNPSDKLSMHRFPQLEGRGNNERLDWLEALTSKPATDIKNTLVINQNLQVVGY